jgi:hypothetical protein
MPGKRILALEFSNFLGGGHPDPLSDIRHVCLFSEVAPVPEILDPPCACLGKMAPALAAGWQLCFVENTSLK